MTTMTRFRLALPLLLTLGVLPAGAVPADRDIQPREMRVRAIAEFEHPLLDADRAELARAGVTLVQPVGRRSAIVRGTPEGLDRLESLGLVRRLEGIPSSRRVHPTAMTELARKGTSARIAVMFHADVPLQEALALLKEAGAWPTDPLLVEFQLPRSVWVHASAPVVEALARLDPVLLIHGPEGEVEAMNRTAATISNVAPLHEAPYELTGAGVTVGILDVGSADAAHPEFEGRVTAHSGGANAQHPTHVTGTVAAKGIRPEAKGMAPGVTVHQFSHGSGYLEQKDEKIVELGMIADNNSWGFVTGWGYDDDESDVNKRWGWYDNDAFGGYSPTTAGMDQIARNRRALILFSAGNDGNENGPAAFPFAHVHANDTNDEVVWCQSNDGSGTDCPATPCATRCETGKHPSDGIFSNLSRLASAKNVLAVGAINTSLAIATFSSRGPTRDGRIKPDLVARGVNQYSTFPNNSYGTLQGTSMSTPVVTGISALITEQWKILNGTSPDGDVLKALLIQGTRDLGKPGPDYTFGFGLADAKASVDTVIANGTTEKRVRRGSLRSGESIEYPFNLTNGATARLTLTWFDPELLGITTYDQITLINDLDLEITAPDGSTVFPWILDPANIDGDATRGRNSRDTVEQVEFLASQSGTYKAIVRASAIPGTDPQDFAIVGNADFGAPAAPCIDPYEPNDTAQDSWGRLLPDRGLSSVLCGANDVDQFRFVVDRSGPVSVTVTSLSGAALSVSLSAPGIGSIDRTVSAGGSGTLTTSLGSGTGQPVSPVTFVLRVAGSGEAGYSIATSYETTVPNRQRRARR